MFSKATNSNGLAPLNMWGSMKAERFRTLGVCVCVCELLTGGLWGSRISGISKAPGLRCVNLFEIISLNIGMGAQISTDMTLRCVPLWPCHEEGTYVKM